MNPAELFLGNLAAIFVAAVSFLCGVLWAASRRGNGRDPRD